MALTYLQLCNEVLKPLNEVVLTQSTFNDTRGFHSAVKSYVNSSINDINTAETQWPFNKRTETQTCTPGVYTYALASDVKLVDWDSFRVVKDDNLGAIPRYLPPIAWDVWLQRYYKDQETNGAQNQPQRVVREQQGNFLIYPTPDKAYDINYDVFAYPTKLVAYNDTTNIPDTFENVIVNRALYYAYKFRSNFQAMVDANEQYRAGLKHMRTILTNRYESVTDNRVNIKRM